MNPYPTFFVKNRVSMNGPLRIQQKNAMSMGNASLGSFFWGHVHVASDCMRGERERLVSVLYFICLWLHHMLNVFSCFQSPIWGERVKHLVVLLHWIVDRVKCKSLSARKFILVYGFIKWTNWHLLPSSWNEGVCRNLIQLISFFLSILLFAIKEFIYFLI